MVENDREVLRILAEAFHFEEVLSDDVTFRESVEVECGRVVGIHFNDCDLKGETPSRRARCNASSMLDGG